MSNPTPEARLRRLHDNVEYPLVGEVILGRHSDCDIVIDDEGGVSRRHARLTGGSDGVYVSDLGSLNGTLVNGDEATEPTQLQNGDRLVFDEYEYEVIIPAVEEVDPDDDVTRIANREDILERMAAANKTAESAEAESAESEILIDNEVPVHEVAVKEVASNEVVTPEFQFADVGEITDSTRNPPLDSDPDPDEVGMGASDDAEPGSSISASDPFERVVENASEPAPEPAPEPSRRQPDSAPAAQIAKPDEPAKPQPKVDTDFPDEADLPGAWANTSAVLNTDNQTMLAQFVVPARNVPAEVDISSITVPALVIRTGDFEGKVLTLNAPSTEWLVGSGSASDLRIKQEGISSRHAVFVREQNKLKLCDELSVNGTFINGNRINVGYVGHGDVLRFGPVECELFMPNFKRGPGGGRKGSPMGTAAGSRKKKRGSKKWLTGLLVAAVIIPVIAIAVLLLLSR